MSAEPGLLFDEVAEEYERVRHGYPPVLVEAASAIASLRPGSRVLEVGCGTGKLTQLLVEGGLVVDAIDPGLELVRVARRKLGDAPVRFHVARFEEVDLPAAGFEAAFSATAFHWVEPAVGWSKMALLVRPGGIFALLGHVAGYTEDRCRALDEEMHAIWKGLLPDTRIYRLREAAEIDDAVAARLGNVSELWSWLSQHNLQRPEAAELFEDVRVQTLREESEFRAQELLAVIRTTSSYLRLDERDRSQLEDRLTAAVDKAGGIYNGVALATLVTARARPGNDPPGPRVALRPKRDSHPQQSTLYRGLPLLLSASRRTAADG